MEKTYLEINVENKNEFCMIDSAATVVPITDTSQKRSLT